ncbi:MAG TPA: NADPH-dependent 7-cyano-7-deazaguanine reductase QueF [Rhodocyclaceae bacterium]|nr:NADPH-dependent 7-cyano-7-deazaguanine reductase QueF [Rhodocyclaceae bacterium]
MNSKHTSLDAGASPLGKPTSYRSQYAPELLFPIVRSDNRRPIGIASDILPFVGEDLWNAYELSWLNPKGKPIVALGEFRVPVTSPYLIESKSLKLYLNSFNQTRCEDINDVAATIARDLSAVVSASVLVKLRLLDDARTQRVFGIPSGICIDALDVEVDSYTPNANLLRVDNGKKAEDETLYTHLLKSNCLVTGQPDWGTLIVRYSGPAIDRAALLRYIISFREHNEFHEQCVERIFMDISQHCKPERLAVWARYTRRGGLDINPFRASAPGFQLENISEMRQ